MAYGLKPSAGIVVGKTQQTLTEVPVDKLISDEFELAPNSTLIAVY